MSVSSFITEVETDAAAIEQDVVTGLKAGLNYVDNVIVTDLAPELMAALKQALSLVESTTLSGILNSVTATSTTAA
jgi:hypothetical protein